MPGQYTKYYQHSGDPVVDAQCNGKFQLLYSSTVPVNEIVPNYSIDTLVKEININIDFFGLDVFDYTDHRQPTVDIAQFVKINKLYHNLQTTDNIKPWLLLATPQGMTTVCGESRRRAMELLPLIKNISAFVCVPTALQDQYASWTKIDRFDQFAEAVGCNIGTPFWFSVTEENGLEWYEVALDNYTGTTGPGFRDRCIIAIRNYVKSQNKDFRFDTEWFKQQINWDQYVLE